MSDLLEQVKADAYVRLVMEYEEDGTINPTRTVTDPRGPADIGEDPFDGWQTFYVPIDAVDRGGLPTPNITKTILTFTNMGHVLPMEWAITRTIKDWATGDVISTDTATLTLVTSATFTCQTSGAETYAEFSATFQSPV
jgi:hypothetical protein